MADETTQLHPALRIGPWPQGDPFVLLEAVLRESPAEQQKQIAALYLDSVSATLQAQVALVNGMRNIIGGSVAGGAAAGAAAKR